ncbi:ubiquinone biosynthesis regulatory protein kinase UbiB [Rudaea sp.]|uniref:ubiquinone biosynthesis regulatory protein kinase UbiB n=1 Tax=Rudaea sp. TaxID=2136325 RepID=UPI0039C97D8B
MRQIPRMLRIAATLVRYRLDDIVELAPPFRPLLALRPLLPRPRADIAQLARGARLRLALIELGPIFVKFGQILSTRRDLLPTDVADELAQLQDQVPPFPGDQARATIEAALGAPIASLFADFDTEPLASASIAQVHAARLWPPSDPAGHLPPQAGEGTGKRPAVADGLMGKEVAVKVLRPGIQARIRADIDLLRALGELAQRWHPAADKIRPREIVAEIETTLLHELDLQREGANASVLKRNFIAGDDLYVPEVFWSHSKDDVLTLERVHGIAADDLAALDAAGVDRIALAEKGVRVFYTQVFRDNFFHADAHPGNIWIDPARRENPRFIALDFGIMGSLAERDQYWLAENFMAMFDRDYRRIAELHLAAGWIPPHIRLDELEAAVRTVCEPYFTRPLSEISLGEVVVKMFHVARKFELTLQPQLILLQKTLLNIEGIGRSLHPQIDIWAVARPVLADILRRRYGIRRTLRELRTRAPEWLAAAPQMPELIHAVLKKAAAGELDSAARAAERAQRERDARTDRRQLVALTLGATALLIAALFYCLDSRSARIAHVAWTVWLSAGIGVLAFVSAWRRSR